MSSDIATLSSEEMATRLDELDRRLLSLRFQHASGELADTSQIKKTRRDIARARTARRAASAGDAA
jgi:large subunit ribosomal protein L29